jgi:hypothetical protein
MIIISKEKNLLKNFIFLCKSHIFKMSFLFKSIIVILLASLIHACEPPDCDRPDCGSCGKFY